MDHHRFDRIIQVLDSPVTRRTGFGALVAGALIHAWPASNALAQAATPAASAGMTDLDFPNVVIVVDDHGFTVPAEVSAGRVLMTVENTGVVPLHFFAARVPDTVSNEQLLVEMTADEEPDWFDMTELTMLGNPDWPAVGGRARGVVDLSAGRWLLIDPVTGREPAMLNVGAGNDGEVVEPSASIAIELHEMAFSGFDEPIPAGPRVWKITNTGALEHEVAVLAVEPGTTNADVLTMLTAMMTAEFDPEAFAPRGGQGISSRGVTSWQLIDLDPGSYAAICMTPMPGEDFTPHALEGMIQVFSVV